MNETVKTVTCADCGGVIDLAEDDFIELPNGSYICVDCLDDYSFCENCQEWHREYDAVFIQGIDEYWCEDCAANDAFQCDECGDWYPDNGRYGAHDDCGTNLCDHCYEWRDYVTCGDCGRIVRADDAYHSDRRGEYYCEYCRSEYEEEDDDYGINSYGYKPCPVFGRRSSDAPDAHFFGVELEVDTKCDTDHDSRGETARDVVEAAQGRVYAKRDGSLDNGIEFVTHPGTLAHHTYEMHWADICRLATKHGYFSHDVSTCGLHIHVDVPGNSDVALKCALLVDVMYDDGLTEFARRADNHYAIRPAINHTYLDGYETATPTEQEYMLLDATRSVHTYGRYQAVNTQNAHTTEFRLFRGTLRRNTIIASIQLVSNIVAYAESHTFAECYAACFRDIINVAPYKELVAYCAERGISVGATAAA